MKTPAKSTTILIVASLVTTLFTYRSIFNGKLLGDPFDARLQLVLHEHWWRWFNGLVEFRNTEFFYPYKTALGYSDVFFSQGIIYSLFRYLDFGLAESWMNTNILFLLVGNLSWVLISLKFLKKFYFQLLLVVTSCMSLSFVYYFTLNPNMVGYSFLPYFFLFFKSIESEKDFDKKQFKSGLFIILFLIYALSCWYGAFFVAIIIIVKKFIDFLMEFSKRKNLKFNFLMKLNWKIIGVLLPIQLFLLWLFYYVYISVADQPSRPSEEMLRNSPRLNFLPNGAGVNGGYLSGSFLKNLYIQFGLDKENEYTIGIGISVFLIALIIILIYIIRRQFSTDINSFLAAIVICYLYFINFNGYSLHRIFFELIPGVNSIRNPSRYVVIVGFVAIFLIFYVFEKIFTASRNKLIKSLIIIFTILVVLDQYRAPFIGWDKSQLINTDLMAKKDEIVANCDYFYYDKPGGWWYDQIEAMTFAIQAGVPTVNGYSGAFPPEYPTEPFNSQTPPLKIFDWIEKIDKDLRGCFIAGSIPIKYFNQQLISIDMVGFTNLETNGKVSWQWAVSPNPYIFIINYSKNKLIINFELYNSKCSPKSEIRITEDGVKDIYQGIIKSEGLKFSHTLDFSNAVVKRIELISKLDACKVDNDPRDLFFEMKNFSSEQIN